MSEFPQPKPAREAVNPPVIGRADFSNVTKYLDQEISFTALFPAPNAAKTSAAFDPTAHVGGGFLVGIPVEEDVEDGESEAVSRMVVTKWPIQRQVFPCLIAARFEHRWNVVPYIYDDVQAYGTSSFLFQESWVKALYNLAEAELEPLLRYAMDLTNVTHAKITREAITRCNYFPRMSPDAFFSSRDAYIRWMVASSWAAWEEESLATDERIADLGTADPTIQLTTEAFLAICDGLALPHSAKAGQSPKPVSALPSVEAPEPKPSPLLTMQERELELLRDWNPEEEDVFSYGGPPELGFDLDTGIADDLVLGEARNVAVDHLAKTRWWWRSAFHNLSVSIPTSVEHEKWPDELMYLFRDNWERSAFVYEFRARYGGRTQWDFFGKPWVKLNNSQRGVLSCMWPVDHASRYKITPNLHPFIVSQMQSKIRLHVVIDAEMPDSEVAELVTAKLNEERKSEIFPDPKLAADGPVLCRGARLSFLTRVILAASCSTMPNAAPCPMPPKSTRKRARSSGSNRDVPVSPRRSKVVCRPFDTKRKRAAPLKSRKGTARPVSPYSFTVLRAKNRSSSATAMVMWREARQTAISLASIFRRNVLSLMLSMAAAS